MKPQIFLHESSMGDPGRAQPARTAHESSVLWTTRTPPLPEGLPDRFKKDDERLRDVTTPRFLDCSNERASSARGWNPSIESRCPLAVRHFQLFSDLFLEHVLPRVCWIG